ncbi:TIGR03557 family F420-dependent LLM class oxidoreductase [Yonghaparkia sp. Root332]|uniref:TIGR03557 family F420-dependent LLM class oxidoreductase n=1 Tax=Yonghaparkia sp. Root332 TaxID=1736516 RepID=UPI0006FD060F|nr:TIGR03557 family F420-dependent LLM class oxidoreductase [Yonghaparkia sp. Root332]KQV24567.1 LLM class F420-dependent oxidoreductase [Yonghaparkia sp. Root332]
MTAPQIGYAAALEQFAPLEAIELAALAEQHGFAGTVATEGFQPWTPQQGQSSFVWNVVSALGARTSGALGVGPVSPTFRWHPAMVAQASATLAAMYPGRHWLALGSGEAMSDHIVGERWPEPAERIARMFEALSIIKKLFSASLAGRDTKHDGDVLRLETARLWTMPEFAPDILIQTAGPLTAKRAGRSADGLLIEAAPIERIGMLFQRFEEGAREAGRDLATTTRVLRLHLSWAPTDEEAMGNALAEWPNGGMRFAKSDIRSPFDLEQIAKLVRPEDFGGRVVVSSDPDVHRANIQAHLDLGFDGVYLHNVGRNQREFLEVFGRDVLPALHR